LNCQRVTPSSTASTAKPIRILLPAMVEVSF
jgi:hypothetical protein